MAPVPAKRYDIFIKAFEKHVAEVQQKISRMNNFQRLYEAVRWPLEEANLKNDVKLVLRENGVSVDIGVMSGEPPSKYEKLARMIENSLIACGLYSADLATEEDESFFYENFGSFHTEWRIAELSRDGQVCRVRIELEVPFRGTDHIQVETIVRDVPAYKLQERKITWHEQPFKQMVSINANDDAAALAFSQPQQAKDIPF